VGLIPRRFSKQPSIISRSTAGNFGKREAESSCGFPCPPTARATAVGRRGFRHNFPGNHSKILHGPLIAGRDFCFGLARRSAFLESPTRFGTPDRIS
jgi:hypothetical protein